MIEGKLQETSNLSNSTARATDLTKITTYENHGYSEGFLEPRNLRYLIELKRVEQLIQLPVLSNFL